MKTERIKIALSGAGGYGYYYLREMLDTALNLEIELRAVYDPNIDELQIGKELSEKKVPLYNDYETYASQLHDCDLAVIVSPIQFHTQQAKDALESGCHVLLDKPLAGNVQQAQELLSVEQEVDSWLMVGYQWSYSEAIMRLKLDALQGVFGQIEKAKTLVFWPRDYAYFSRNNWAGKRITEDGSVVNDSLANNAMAHFIHNLLFLAGPDPWTCAEPLKGQSELFRAYPIENYDTAAIKWTTSNDIEMLFYGSHVTRTPRGPLFILECEKATVYYGELSNDIIAVFTDGSTLIYGNPDDTDQFEKLWLAIRRCQGQPIDGVDVQAAFQQTRLIEAVAGTGHITDFPENRIVLNDPERRYVNGLGYMLLSSYHQGFMPSSSTFELKGTIQAFTL